VEGAGHGGADAGIGGGLKMEGVLGAVGPKGGPQTQSKGDQHQEKNDLKELNHADLICPTSAGY
jgi:hypothetical protein